MKSYLPLLSLTLLIASCSAYRSGQTPDDVYYSPTEPAAGYVAMENKDDQKYVGQDGEASYDDPYLRMQVYDHRRWSLLDEDYYYPSYSYVPDGLNYGLGFYYGNSWQNYLTWNYAYNPYFNSYYSPYSFYSPYNYHLIPASTVVPSYNRPRTFNLNVYHPTTPTSAGHNQSSVIRVFGQNSSNSGRASNYRNSGTNAGNFLRNTFNSGGNGNSGFNTSSGSRSVPSSSSGGSSRGSAPASSGGGRRF